MKQLSVCLTLLMLFSPLSLSNDKAIENIIKELDGSALSHAEMKKELSWFSEKGTRFKNKTITVVSEDIPTHRWERDVLAKHFKALTGININYDIIGEAQLLNPFLSK